MATKYKNNMSYTAAQDILQLINLFNNDNDSNIPNLSKYHYKKIIDSFSTNIIIYHFCNKCSCFIGSEINKNSRPVNKSIQEESDAESAVYCGKCKIFIDPKTNIKSGNFFLYIPLAQQLKDFFETSDIAALYSKSRHKKHNYAIEDIFDGKLYNQGMKNDMISLNCSVDGVPVFSSYNFSMQPVTCTINELAPNKRRKHILLVSLWCGSKEMKMSEYLKPLIEESKLLFGEGFTYTKNDIIYVRKVKILMFICDSVARPKVFNGHQFNGSYGCNLCLHSGKRVKKGNGSVNVYPLDADGNAYGAGRRTHQQTLHDHAKAQQYGMKGIPVISEIPDFDVVEGLPPDYMHAVLLGVCRQFCNLWFDSLNHAESFYHGKMLTKIDNYLTSFKPTLNISRIPRKMSNRIHWKAHEWCAFLLYYSIPLLKATFSSQYVNHWSLLVDGISILLGSSILRSEIEFAKRCLFTFVRDTEKLYGEMHISFNLHLLTHLADSVINWGPLWSHSAFLFEDFYQEILKYIRSSQGVSTQVVDSFRERYVMNNLMYLYPDQLTSKQKDYLSKTLNKKLRPSPTLHLEGISMLGNAKITTKITRECFFAFQRININIPNDTVIQQYFRAYINGEVIHSKQYSRVNRRCNYFIMTNNYEIFEIKSFIVLKNQNSLKCYALGYYFNKHPSGSIISNQRLKHIIRLQNIAENLAALPVSEIKEKVIILEIEEIELRVACIHINRHEMLD